MVSQKPTGKSAANLKVFCAGLMMSSDESIGASYNVTTVDMLGTALQLGKKW